jgi:hypothetical protein
MAVQEVGATEGATGVLEPLVVQALEPDEVGAPHGFTA